ncbi:MAG: hypothetical protein JO069_21545 [Verrucomicrobia bacterium]|nr:hypothetical protein [Verrucomicrobiota bacterium]
MQSRTAAKTLLIIGLVLTSAVARSFGADNPFESGESSPTPAPSVDVYTWYQIGEFKRASDYMRFNQAVADNLEGTYKGFYELLVKAHCSKASLDGLKQLVALYRTLPFNKSWSEWSEKEKQTWNQPPATYEKFVKALQTDAKQAPESWFFYWLGFDGLDLAWTLPYAQQEGETQAIQNLLKRTTSDCAFLMSDNSAKGVFDALNPDAAQAIEVVASLKSKVNADNPLANEELTSADVQRAVQAGQVLRKLAKEHKLLK